MKALVFGSPPDKAEVRPVPSDEIGKLIASMPFGLHDVDEPLLRRPDWVLVKPILAGICGSDSKLVMGDFSEGDMDNPMSLFSSLPMVPGHEVVAEVVSVGPAARGVDIGQRVVLDPWLTCSPRGIEPVCPACAAGDLNLCWSFTIGDIGPGVHVGVATGAPGAWAELMAVHDSMLHGVPDSVSDVAAVLADPFAVSLHAIVRHPPPDRGRVIVYGAGALGLTSVAVLKCLYPRTQIAVVGRYGAQRDMAEAFGADIVVEHEPRESVIEALAKWSGAVLHRAPVGLPVTHPGAVDVVYDTIAKPETLEVGVRLLAERGVLAYTGVATPGRWESTPIYFKEITVAGSNAFGFEEIDGIRKHAISHYLDMVDGGRIDISAMLTHRFALEDWWPALTALAHAERTGALKVAFAPNGALT